MKTIKKILVPVDFTENSKSLLQHAVNFANFYHTEVILLHVYNRPLSKGNKNIFERGIIHKLDTTLLHWRENRIEDKFNNLLKDLSNIYNIRFTIIKEVGLLTEGIQRTISRYGVDMVFMGSRYMANKRNLWRSKAAKLTNRLKVPILIIPYQFDFNEGINIAFAYDLKKIKDLNELNIIKIFTSFFKANIHIFTVCSHAHLTPEEIKNLAILTEHFEPYQPEFHMVRNSDIEKGIIQYTKTYKISLLTILHRSHNALKGAFHSSIAKKMAAKSEVPVLSIDEHN